MTSRLPLRASTRASLLGAALLAALIAPGCERDPVERLLDHQDAMAALVERHADDCDAMASALLRYNEAHVEALDDLAADLAEAHGGGPDATALVEALDDETRAALGAVDARLAPFRACLAEPDVQRSLLGGPIAAAPPPR